MLYSVEMRLLVVFLLGSVFISACKSASDQDPHRLHQDPNNLIYLLVFGLILVFAVLYFVTSG